MWVAFVQEKWLTPSKRSEFFFDLTRPSLLLYPQLHGNLKNQEPTVSENLQPSNHQRRHNRVGTTLKPPPQGISIMIHLVLTWMTSPTRLSLHDRAQSTWTIFSLRAFLSKKFRANSLTSQLPDGKEQANRYVELERRRLFSIDAGVECVRGGWRLGVALILKVPWDSTHSGWFCVLWTSVVNVSKN